MAAATGPEGLLRPFRAASAIRSRRCREKPGREAARSACQSGAKIATAAGSSRQHGAIALNKTSAAAKCEPEYVALRAA